MTGAVAEWGDEIPPDRVANLVRALSQTLRARQIYTLGNPTYQRFLKSLRTGFAELWERTNELVLQIEADAIVWRGTNVYKPDNRTDSVSFLLYKDGVRELAFARGFETTELEPFVEVLHRARHLRPTDEDDLLTLLWTEDFSLFHYTSEDLLGEGLEVPQPDAPALPDGSRVFHEVMEGEGEEANAASEAKPVASVDLGALEPTLRFLEERDLEQLRAEIAIEMCRDVRSCVLGALFDSLETLGPAKQEEMVKIMQDLLPRFLGQGDLQVAAEIVGELMSVAGKNGVLADGARQRVNVLLNELSAPAAVDELMRALLSGVLGAGAEQLAAFLQHLREGALGPLIRAAAAIRQEELQAVVSAAAERLAAGHRGALVQQIESADADVAAGAARLAGDLQVTEAAPALARALGHPDTTVRLAVVEAAAKLRTAEAQRMLLDGLRDPDRRVRIVAARAAGSLRYEPALAPLQASVEGKEIQDTDLTEKLAVFEAFGALNQPTAVAVLDRILNGRGFLGRREPSELRACAAMGLARANLPAARDAIVRAESDDDPVVRAAVARALRERS